MKKIFYILLFTSVLIFSSCGEKENLTCGDYNSGDIFKDDCNTCSCENGEIFCTEIACDINEVKVDKENQIKFNSDLTTYEKEWLNYFEGKYPNSRIYHMKTDLFNCEKCYELYYKKDREILKIKILNGEIDRESKVTSDIEVYIENEDVCKLFQGEWNTCPKLCPTDEELCVTQCGDPKCEFDETKITYKKEGEVCGGLDKGDCEFGFTCSYKTQDDVYGVCISN